MTKSAFALEARGLRVRQDPDDVLDYAFDWSAWLDLDAIATSIWASTPAGLTLASPSHLDGVARVWISGGTLGASYLVTNTLTTAGGRTVSRSFWLDVVNR
jgi:hypothetical protein